MRRSLPFSVWLTWRNGAGPESREVQQRLLELLSEQRQYMTGRKHQKYCTLQHATVYCSIQDSPVLTPVCKAIFSR